MKWSFLWHREGFLHCLDWKCANKHDVQIEKSLVIESSNIAKEFGVMINRLATEIPARILPAPAVSDIWMCRQCNMVIFMLLVAKSSWLRYESIDFIPHWRREAWHGYMEHERQGMPFSLLFLYKFQHYPSMSVNLLCFCSRFWWEDVKSVVGHLSTFPIIFKTDLWISFVLSWPMLAILMAW